jgi:hypothetical protein
MIEALEQRQVPFTGSDSGKFLFAREKKRGGERREKRVRKCPSDM